MSWQWSSRQQSKEKHSIQKMVCGKTTSFQQNCSIEKYTGLYHLHFSTKPMNRNIQNTPTNKTVNPEMPVHTLLLSSKLILLISALPDVWMCVIVFSIFSALDKRLYISMTLSYRLNLYITPGFFPFHFLWRHLSIKDQMNVAVLLLHFKGFHYVIT